jgi:uncharacterized MAPEG superfamily protein
MTTDLTYLALTAFLCAILWIPYVVCQVMTNGVLQPKNYVDPSPRPLPAWGERAHRAYLNGVETFAPFAALVIVAHLANKVDGTTVFWTIFFFWVRLAHAVVYLLAIPYIRTLLFVLGFIAVLGLFWTVIG